MPKFLTRRKRLRFSLPCRRRFLRALGLVGACVLFLVGSVVLLSAAVQHRTEDRILSGEVLWDEAAPDCILVLGCGVRADGSMSDMLTDRMKTAISLWKQAPSGTLLILSGDRQEDGSYDEVGAMEAFALENGVPEEVIRMDPKGYSTYESLENLACEMPGARVLVVTQEYHLYRALYIGERQGLEALGVSADLRSYRGQFWREVREVLARVKDVVYLQRAAAR